MSGLTSKTIRNLFWSYGTFATNKLLVFITTVILARLISPDDFGLLGVSVILLEYLENIRNFGLDAALIYSKEDVNKASDASFILTLASGLILTVAAFLSAPLVADFFRDPRIIPIVQVMSLSLLINNLGNTHQARITKSLNFKRLAALETSRALVKGVVSIVFALAGFGVWSLVWGRIAGTLWSTTLYWIVEKWRPTFQFDWKIARPMLGYGIQIIMIGFQAVIFNNIDYLIVGRRLGSEQLGFYTLAFRLPELLVIGFVSILGQILFPTYSSLNNDKAVMAKAYLRIMRYVSMIVVPLGLGLFLTARDFTLLFYTDVWTPSIPVMEVLSLYAVVYALAYNTGDIFKASGRPGILNQIAILRVIIIVPALWIAANYSITGVAYGQLLVNIFIALLSIWVATRLVNISFLEVLRVITPALISGVIMVVGVLLLKTVLPTLPLLLDLVINVSVGAALFLLAMWFLDQDTFKQVLQFRYSLRAKLS